MLQEILKPIKTAFILFILFTLLTGLIYPLIVTGIAQVFFPWQANGSIIKKHDQALGSLLIGQSFTEPKYFWSRPSATTPFPYNALSSSGSNMGPSNPDFLKTVKHRISYLQKENPKSHYPIPVDLVTASGSGLDPEISPAAAFYQASRIAKTRSLSEKKVHELIRKLIQKPSFGILGEPRVNVLKLNLELDYLSLKKRP